ncbi:MAG: TRAP transporter small permease subunit [Rhodobiaceae bacterium]|jgi:TRAP-type C4-dicarboxylate transport system permease small subunit
MGALLTILRPLQWLNDLTGRVGRWLSIGAIAIMVAVILLQVFCRYVLNNALPWPDEAARFMMLWLTGLMAPVAFRHGGMVAITGVLELLPRQLVSAFSLLLLVTSLAVLVVGAQMGLKHVDSGWLFASSSLKLPLFLIGMKSVKIKLAWMYMSLLVGVWLMILVNIELILRSIVVALGGANRLRAVQMPGQNVAETG